MGRIQFKVGAVGEPDMVSPEVRYAQLHRDVDRGLASDKCLAELCETCLRLGKVGEAARTLQSVGSPQEARRLMALLEHHGVILHGTVADQPGDAAFSASVMTTRPGREPKAPPRPRVSAGTESAPSATISKPQVATVDRALLDASRETRGPAGSESSSFVEEFQDASRFLFRDHMPLTVMVLTLMFPAAAGCGFLVPAGLGFVSFALRLVPTLAVVAIFTHLARAVLVEASTGNEDPSPFPDMLRGVHRHGARELGAVAILGLACFGPAGLVSLAGLPWHEVLLVGLLGVAYFPLAVLGLGLRSSWEGALPARVASAAFVDVRGFLALAGCTAVATAVLVVVWALTAGGALYLQTAMAGPLLVAPGFLLVRLLGRHYYKHTRRFASIYGQIVRQPRLVRPAALPDRPARRAMPDAKPAPNIARRRAPADGRRRTKPRTAAPKAREVAANAPRRPSAAGRPKAKPRAQAKPQAQARPQAERTQQPRKQPRARPVRREPQLQSSKPDAAPQRAAAARREPRPARRPDAQPAPRPAAPSGPQASPLMLGNDQFAGTFAHEPPAPARVARRRPVAREVRPGASNADVPRSPYESQESLGKHQHTPLRRD